MVGTPWNLVFLLGCTGRYTCMNHIAAGTTGLPGWSEDISNPLHAQEGPEDENHLN